jgi:hypothetical protein
MHKILGIWSEIQVYHWCKESCELWQQRHGYEGHIRHKPKLESKKNLKMFGAVSMNDWSKTGFSLVTPWTSTEARTTCVLVVLSSTKHWNKAEFFPMSNKMILSSQDCKQRDGLKDSRTSKHTLVKFLVINLSNNSYSCGWSMYTFFSIGDFSIAPITRLEWTSSHQCTNWGWARSTHFADEHPPCPSRFFFSPPLCPEILYLPLLPTTYQPHPPSLHR